MKCCCSPSSFLKLCPESFKNDARSILKFSWPIFLSSLTEFVVPVVALLFVGQLGETQLAAIGLGISYSNLVGMAQVVGLDTATQTLSSQSFGAGNLHRYGVISQRGVIMQLILLFTISPLWINAEQILLKLGQNKVVARDASLFILTRIPSLMLSGIFFTMKTYVLCQGVAEPLLFIGVAALAFSIVANLIFVTYLEMGLVGSAIAIDLADLCRCLILFGYIRRKKISQTWPGWSAECLLQWGQFVKLAIPGALMIIFDWGTAEAGVFLMGLVGEVELGAQSVVLNIISTLFMLAIGLSIAASVKVGNFLGSGEPRRAINAAKVTMIIFLILALFNGVLLVCLKDYIGYVFSKSKNVVAVISKVCPLIALYHFLDGSQGVLSGILRGLGLQNYGAVINFIGFVVIGLPLGAVLGLVVHLGVIGFWSGMGTGLVLQVIWMVTVLVCIDWKKHSKEARKRAEAPDLKFSDDSVKDDESQVGEDTQLIQSDPKSYAACEEEKNKEVDTGLVEVETKVTTHSFQISDRLKSWELVNVAPFSEEVNKYIIIRTIFVLLIPFCSVTFGVLARFISNAVEVLFA